MPGGRNDAASMIVARLPIAKRFLKRRSAHCFSGAVCVKMACEHVCRRKTLKIAKNPYDAVAYPGQAYPSTHPNRLAVMAMLHGLTPPAVGSCRVLEIACGDGANLIPMAYTMPAAEFVGFDLAHAPIERGVGRVEELGLKNIRLFQGDLLAVGPELGRFDYIIAHGLYSWVPEPVRDRLLALCNELLTENGVAFVSYNALPGGYVRMMLREMMLAPGNGIDDSEEQVAEGLSFLRLVCETRPEGDAFRVLIESQLQRLDRRPKAATRHDELSGIYHPVRFLDFAEHAQRHGLRYLCEAELPVPSDPCYRPDLQPVLEQLAGGDELKKEQLLDSMRVRGFRETLLCRAERTVRWDFDVGQLRNLSLASVAMAEPGEKPGATAFALPSGARMESNHGGVMALLQTLSEAWPHAVAVEELAVDLADAGLPLDGDGAAWLIRLAIGKMIELRAWSPPLAHEIGERPKASACSRQEGMSRGRATTLLHTTAAFEDAKIQHLLGLLDGTRDRSELVAAMSAEFPDEAESELVEGIERGLGFFQRAGMLES